MADYPDIKTWNLAGHSLGGVAATMYYKNHQDSVQRVALLGSFVYGDVPHDNIEIIYGTNDGLLNVDKIRIQIGL